MTRSPDPATSDTSLIDAIAAGRDDALEELVRRYRGLVFAVVLRILASAADAEEVVQDVFLLVWKNASRFRGDAKVATWLHTIARNAAVTRLRRVRMETVPLDAVVRGGHDLVSDQPDPERQAAAAELVRHLWSRIARLPPSHRAVIVEIAGRGAATPMAAPERIPPGTIKSRRHRVRLALRATFSDGSCAAATIHSRDPDRRVNNGRRHVRRRFGRGFDGN